jgi:hypothetical protein
MRDLYARLDSPHLGWIPDFGASTSGLSPSLLNAFRAKGVSDALLDALAERWHAVGNSDVERDAEFAAITQLAREHGAGEHALSLAVFCVGIHGHMAPGDWNEIMDDVVHVHGKFFGIGPDGREPAVPYEQLLEVFYDGGYEGYVSSEWEGWHWDASFDPFTMVAGHQALERRILERLAVRHA